jgi:hypothetical protein
MSKSVKIVIDADVVIHFIKGESLHLLPRIFPAYKYVILDELLNKELRNNYSTRLYLDNLMQYFPELLSVIKWDPDYEMMREFSILHEKFGLVESMSLAYCKFNHDVVASSNITEITNYCEENDIQYITTMDFIWQAYITKLMSEEESNTFSRMVIDKGSKLPCKRIKDFKPRELHL